MTDPKATKPIPSADEINAYLELSAARTKLRLPLAKGAALMGPEPTAGLPAAEKNEKRPLSISSAKKLPTRPEEARRADSAGPGDTDAEGSEVWRPFSSDDKR